MRRWWGEYILYKGNIIFGGIYDNRFLIKKTPYSLSLKLKEVIPYPTSKGMLLIDSEDPDYIKEIVDTIYEELKKE